MDLDGNIALYWITFFLLSFSGGSFGILFGTIARTSTEAALMLPAALIPILIFSDSLIALETIPNILLWLVYLNPLYYLLRSLYIIEFDGVTYPRILDEDDEQICSAYEDYQNSTLDIFSAPNCTQILLDIAEYYNITDFSFSDLNISEPDVTIYPFDFNISTGTTSSTSTPYNLLNDYQTINVTKSEEEEQLDLYCTREISSDWFFDYQKLDPNDLTEYLIFTAIIAVLIRLIAVCLLKTINKNGFSWCRKKIREKVSKCINSNQVDHKDSVVSTAISISTKTTEEIELQHNEENKNLRVNDDDDIEKVSGQAIMMRDSSDLN